MTTSFDPDLPLAVHPLTYLDEGEEVTVGRADTGSFAVLPADGAALLRRLESGLSPSEGKRWYAQEYGEDVDMDEFVAVLDELELLVRAGEQAAEVPPPVRWQRLGRALFSPVALVGFALLVLASVVVMILRPELAPHYQNLFFTKYLMVLELGVFAGQVPLILVHEAFHALAGRRLGLPSSLRIGRRLYFVVFETALDGLVVMPRRKRYLPMLAGMIFDVVAIAILTLVAALLSTSGGEPLVARICLAMAFGTVLRLSWQLYFFLRTDLYYLIVNVLGCVDLHDTARAVLANRFNRLLGRRDRLVDADTWHPRDLAVARWYSWLLLLGYGFLIAVAALAAIPTAVRMVTLIIAHLQGSASVAGLADSVLFVGLNVAQFVLIGVLSLRSRRAARTAAAATTPAAAAPALSA